MENLKALIEMEDLAEDGRLLLIIILQIEEWTTDQNMEFWRAIFKHRNEIPGPTKVG